ncbi:hypothetical protein [Desulfitibacter alkalitolerans]|uniref:hypothetical protein n=1 Tax=Desulfitibacter alkalitolerans TaxID=264641 RepID=UPI0012EBC636|nr:hypothetical protein [Desulfitibacter alkalitolerans]
MYLAIIDVKPLSDCSVGTRKPDSFPVPPKRGQSPCRRLFFFYLTDSPFYVSN